MRTLIIYRVLWCRFRQVYREHRRGELELDMAAIEQFMLKNQSNADSKWLAWSYFRRLLMFDAVVEAAHEDSRDAPSASLFTRNLILKTGLDYYLLRRTGAGPTAACPLKELVLAGSVAAASTKTAKGAAGTAVAAVSHAATEFDLRLREISEDQGRFLSGGALDFASVFGPAASSGAVLPLKLEICSGAGEWAVNQVRCAWSYDVYVP
jgi:hypothetical protein